MQILITGGYGFIGTHLAERFFKEGHEIIIIDNLSGGTTADLSIKHIPYLMAVENTQCETVFQTHNIDIVIHLASADNDDMNCNGIVNMLSMAQKYEVKKFLFVSSDIVYGNTGEKSVKENFVMPPVSGVALRKKIEEDCCLSIDNAEMDVVVVRVAKVYGPRQLKQNGVIADIMDGVVAGKTVAVRSLKDCFDFIYVTDVVEAILRLSERSFKHRIINISANNAISINKICELLQGVEPDLQIEQLANESNASYVKLDNTLCIQELGWRVKFGVEEGLLKTYEWYKNNANNNQPTVENSSTKTFFQAWRPYIENILTFMVVVILTVNNHYDVTNDIGVDYNFLYIFVMGLLYGKKQALPAAFLSGILLMASFVAKDADFVSILYQVKHMAHLASYLFLGILTGYITDNKDREYHDISVVLANLKNRYKFLEEMYNKNNEIKERLYKQIVNSDDSIGRTYKIIKKLDTIEVENLFTVANAVTTEMMGVRNVAIYLLAKNGYYLRLKTKTGLRFDEVANSLKVEDFMYLKNMLEDKQVFVNKLLIPGVPDMAAPVLKQGKVIAVIQIYKLKFDDLNLNKQNLLKITALLIADALGKAYQYEESVYDKKYIANTRILNEQNFIEIEREIKKRNQEQNDKDFTVMLKISVNDNDYVKLNSILAPLVRDEDFLGMKKDGNIYLLLLNITDDVVGKVKDRFEKVGLLTEVVDYGVDD